MPVSVCWNTNVTYKTSLRDLQTCLNKPEKKYLSLNEQRIFLGTHRHFHKSDCLWLIFHFGLMLSHQEKQKTTRPQYVSDFQKCIYSVSSFVPLLVTLPWLQQTESDTCCQASVKILTAPVVVLSLLEGAAMVIKGASWVIAFNRFSENLTSDLEVTEF